MGEFQLIERIQSKFSCTHQDIIRGIGDDASVTRIQEGRVLISTSDILIEGVHFDLGFTSAHNLGKKSLAVNISDIAAMGGNPRFFLISIGIPPHMSLEFIDEFSEGLLETARSFHTCLVGGDTSRSPEKFIISITLLGESSPGYEVYRSNARVGDLIFVTGNLGDSSLGLEILKKRHGLCGVNDSFIDLLERHNNPTPRVNEGRLLAENRIASAMIDISDGLLSDLGHICDQSRVGARLQLSKLPVSRSFQKHVSEITDRPEDLLLGGGEDYELLFTVDKGNVDSINRLKPRFETKVTQIGEIVSGDHGVTVLDDFGGKYEIKRRGFDHFL